MTTIICYEKPTPNPELTASQHEVLRERVLAARNILNDALDAAAHNGILIEVRLLGCMNVGAGRLGITKHFLVEALPVRTCEEVEADELSQLAKLKFKYETTAGSLLRS